VVRSCETPQEKSSRIEFYFPECRLLCFGHLIPGDISAIFAHLQKMADNISEFEKTYMDQSRCKKGNGKASVIFE